MIVYTEMCSGRSRTQRSGKCPANLQQTTKTRFCGLIFDKVYTVHVRVTGVQYTTYGV